MKRHFKLLAIGLLSGLMITLVVSRISSEIAPGSVTGPMPAAPVSAAQDPTSNEVLPHGMSEQTIARVKELEEMTLKKRQRDQAAEKTPKARAHVQFSKHSAWTKVILTNRQKFEALRAEAAGSPLKRVPCTICDAKGVLQLCVVCDHTGKCPTCRGTGEFFDEVCPTCVGTGKCFLCFGSGKMPCPFCQSSPLMKEVITPDTPDPPNDLPIH